MRQSKASVFNRSQQATRPNSLGDIELMLSELCHDVVASDVSHGGGVLNPDAFFPLLSRGAHCSSLDEQCCTAPENSSVLFSLYV